MRREVKTAIWLALAGFIWAILEFITGLHSSNIKMHATITWFAFLPSVLIYIWHYKGLKKEKGGQLTWTRGFLSGMFVTGVAIPLSQFGFAVFYYLINPNLFSSFAKYSVDNKLMTSDEAAKYFTLSNYLVQIAVGILLIGLVLSVILSLIFKSKEK
jgi:uncharacterized PurR-regulated membrane protein YhhQ (DUF165 family)